MRTRKVMRRSSVLLDAGASFSGVFFCRAEIETVPFSVLHLTLKAGCRTIQIPEELRPLFQRRLEGNTILFPAPDGSPWKSTNDFNAAYRVELRGTAKSLGLKMKMDCNMGRRTCASLLVRAGTPAESVAAILGNSPAMIREHCGRLMPHEVDPRAALIAS